MEDDVPALDRRKHEVFSPGELLCISAVVGNHASHLLSMADQLGPDDLRYALELKQIADKADRMRMPPVLNPWERGS
jgi:hypothetical protein